MFGMLGYGSRHDVTRRIAMPLRGGSHRRREKANSMSTLPYGWTTRDLDAVTKLAGYFRADPRGILGIFNSESGIQPRIGPVAGYYGLTMARPDFIDPVIHDSWIDIVKNRSIVEQLGAIKTYWDVTAKGLLHGDSVSTRARRLGIRGDTVLYSMNFLPARFAVAIRARPLPGQSPTNENGAMTRVSDHDPGTKSGSFYGDNPAFDLDGKGYITILDVQKRIDRMITSGLQNPVTAPLFGSVKKPRSLLTYGVVAGFLGAGVYLIAKD
jgi:hypothetical protein